MTSEDQSSHDTLQKRGFYLEYMTLGWNVVGALVLLVAAYSAHSVALLGCGIDSLLEISASSDPHRWRACRSNPAWYCA
jgi:hypothetical protein